MALEPIGNSIAVDKLKKRLKKRYPNHNFDVKQQPDTRHKAPSLCERNTINYRDVEGNLYCGQRYKLQHEDNPFSYEWRTCGALIKKAVVKDKQTEIPF
tara:strand:+ start:41 stop:337 length:297 start_codon:yes stop_codon:yes gene_type:complete